MIERKFVSQNFKEFQIKEYVKKTLSRVGLSNVKLQRTSLGERLVISASRPGLVVGRGGSTIQRLTSDLKTKFHLENPQIEIEEIKDFSLDAGVVAESIVSQLERFGTQRFKGIGHKSLESVMRAGALGVEVLISGKIPSSRAKTWRFADGYMKKCGDIAITGVDTSKTFACLKTGVVGVQVRIMPGTTKLPDQITFDYNDATSGPIVEEVNTPVVKDDNEEKPKKKASKKASKKATKKTETKDSKKSEEPVVEGDAQ
ncbi:30S ribosomal protein S3 [Candidatus Woesearchaeota archaeon]|nr:30S ribosomal protein S3 [Candidatus Woesearchaeota archaeon]